MGSPQRNSYPDPDHAQMTEGGTHPFYANPQQQPAPQAIMDAQHHHQQQQREQSAHSNPVTENYAPRELAPHPQSYNSSQDASNFALQQMQQMPQQVVPQIDPAAKRPKTSRACDQCRSKKTRCDEVPNPSGLQCMSCRRNNQMCEFSREPQKRGPSKGYIKELAERVDVLESERPRHLGLQYPTTGLGPHSHGLATGYSGAPIRSGHNKRTYSEAEGLHNPSALHAQLQASPYVPFESGSNLTWQQALPTTDSMDPRSEEDGEGMPTRMYYVKVHASFPFLSHKKDRLVETISNQSEKIATTFHAALSVFTFPADHSAVPTKPFEAETRAARYANAVRALQFDPTATQSPAEQLVILQAIMLMISAVECNSPTNVGNRGWYTQALGASTFMYGDLRAAQLHGIARGDDPDAHYLLMRRAFFTLAIMERWNAAGTSSHTLIPDALLKLEAADEIIIGKFGCYALRASFVLGHIMDAVLAHRTDSYVWTLLCAEKDRLVEDLETNFVQFNSLPTFLNLFFDHHVPPMHANLASPHGTLQSSIKLLRMLTNPRGCPPFLLNHHIAALSVTVIDEAIRKHQVGEEVEGVLKAFRDGLASGEVVLPVGSAWADAIGGFVSASLSVYSAEKVNGDGGTTDRAGLQHLADAAVGETEDGSQGQLPPEYKVSASVGYLIHVAQSS